MRTTCRKNKLNEGSGAPTRQSLRKNGKHDVIITSLKIMAKD